MTLSNEAIEELSRFSKHDFKTSNMIRNYVKNGDNLNGFFNAVFSNDLFNVFERADKEHIEKLGDYIKFIQWYCPKDCHGSYEKVQKWIDKKKETK